MTRFTQRPFIALFIPILFTFFSLTAFAQSDIPDYANYQISSIQEIEDLYAAPGNTSAMLTPSGDRLIHFDRTDICVYTPAGSSWTQGACHAVGNTLRGGNGDFAISPNGRWVVLPTYEEALLLFRDTDIQVLDLETGVIVNLTDDGYQGGNFNPPLTARLDIAPVWLNDQQIAFLRYTPDPSGTGEFRGFLPVAIYTVDLPVSGVLAAPQERVALDLDARITSYVLAANQEGTRVAFNVDLASDFDNPDQGVWEADLETAKVRQIVHTARYEHVPNYLSYSADSRYLLALLPSTGEFINSYARVLDVDSGRFIDIDPRFPWQPTPLPSRPDAGGVIAAGWTPEGAALVYVVRHVIPDDEASGVYITHLPNAPGRQILEGDFYTTSCCLRTPINWGANDVILVGRGLQPGILLIQVD